MDLHDDIARCYGRICKRILAIHIYRRATLPGAAFAIQVRLFQALFVPRPPSFFQCVTMLAVSVRHDASRQSALAAIEPGKGRPGGKESFVHRRTSVTRKNICVIIYYLERKIEIFRDTGAAFREIVMTEIRVSIKYESGFTLYSKVPSSRPPVARLFHLYCFLNLNDSNWGNIFLY